jgi:hypothetical protein
MTHPLTRELHDQMAALPVICAPMYIASNPSAASSAF